MYEPKKKRNKRAGIFRKFSCAKLIPLRPLFQLKGKRESFLSQPSLFPLLSRVKVFTKQTFTPAIQPLFLFIRCLINWDYILPLKQVFLDYKIL